MRKLQVNSHVIDDASDMYVIAEIGHNHQGNVEKCKELFRAAAALNATKPAKRAATKTAKVAKPATTTKPTKAAAKPRKR